MEPDIGGRKRNCMKKLIRNKPIEFEGTYGRMRLIKDDLPSPEKLVLRPLSNKITINLNQKTLRFFKAEADRLGGSYQRMIRNLLDHYAETFQNSK